jgi:uncharacterized OB-fold protein
MELIAALDAPRVAERPRTDLAAGTLCGSRCPDCGTVSWPSRAVCHRCGSAGLETVAIDGPGTLVSHTRCWVPRPGLEPPFVIGQVRFPDEVIVFGHVRGLPDDAPVPLPVRVVLADDPATVPAFWFEFVDDEVTSD